MNFLECVYSCGRKPRGLVSTTINSADKNCVKSLKCCDGMVIQGVIFIYFCLF